MGYIYINYYSDEQDNYSGVHGGRNRRQEIFYSGNGGVTGSKGTHPTLPIPNMDSSSSSTETRPNATEAGQADYQVREEVYMGNMVNIGLEK